MTWPLAPPFPFEAPPTSFPDPSTPPVCAETAKAPLPPPPPIDCASTLVELSAKVMMLPVLVTVTLLASPPFPPWPPTLFCIWPPDTLSAPANPPLPPPPPIDCAKTPTEPAPLTRIVPVFVTVTGPPAPPAPPLPPTVDTMPPEPLPSVPLTVNPPLPPPPPTDWA